MLDRAEAEWRCCWRVGSMARIGVAALCAGEAAVPSLRWPCAMRECDCMKAIVSL